MTIEMRDEELISAQPEGIVGYAYRTFGADNFYSTSVNDTKGDNNITIGPGRNDYEIDGADSGFTYWRARGQDETCPNVDSDKQCLEVF